MSTLVVVGIQWGDEGKGKVVDLLARKPRSSHASRAAVTPATRCVVGGKKTIVRLIPLGPT